MKSLEDLLDVYYASVGRNCVLLLNIPPDRRGLFHENDVARLREFRRVLDETFAVNLAEGKRAEADRRFGRGPRFAPGNIVDGDPDSYWAANDGVTTATLEIDLGEDVYFDRIMLQEPIRLGQRISSFSIEAHAQDEWIPAAHGTTIGYKRLLRIRGVSADRIRIIIEDANNTPALSSFGIYRASAGEAGV